MKIQHLLEHEQIPPRQEITQILEKSPLVRIEKAVSCDYRSPDGFWYDQQENEWVSVLEGSAELRFETETVRLQAGDSLLIPAHRRHRIEWTSAQPPCIWLCVFYSPVT